MRKKLIFILLLLPTFCYSQQANCKSFTKEGWRIVYNKFYNKYAVMRGTDDFLVKDHDGEYGVYGTGWERKHCVTCGDKSKSLFNDPCGAKSFMLTYLRKLKEDKWQ